MVVMDRRDRPAETTCRSRPRGFGGGSSAQPQLAPLRSKPHCMQPLGSYSHRGVVLVQFAVCLPNTREGGAPAPHRPIGHRNASNNACPCSSLRLRLRQFVARRMRGRMKCVPEKRRCKGQDAAQRDQVPTKWGADAPATTVCRDRERQEGGGGDWHVALKRGGEGCGTIGSQENNKSVNCW